MQEAPGAGPQQMSEQERRDMIETLKLLTGLQRALIEVKKTLEALVKK
jgi:hypothetical protein